MSSRKILLWCGIGLMFVVAGTAHAAGQVNFGVIAAKTKIGDAAGTAAGTVGVSGAGYHNMVVYGTAVYAAYTVVNNITNETAVYVGKSYDNGLTWKESELVAHAPNINGTGASVAVSTYQGTRYVHVAWGVDLNGNNFGAIYYSRGVDNGSDGWSWTAPVPVITSVNASGAYDVNTPTRNIAADDSGLVHIAATSYDSTTYEPAILYARSTNAGQSFTQETALSGAAAQTAGLSIGPSIAAAGSGDFFLSWWGENSSVYFSKRTSAGWTSPVVVSGYYGGEQTSIAAVDSNHISVAWGGTAPFQSSGPIYVSSSSDGGNTWTPQQIYSGSLYVGYPSLGASASGIVTLIFEAGSNVYFTRNSNSGWSAPVQIQTDGIRPSLAVDASGAACVMSSDSALHAVYFTKEQ